MAEYTLQHTAVEVDNAVGKALSIVANPTMAGTEAALTGLQVGDTKYKVEAGSEVHTYRDSKNYTSADTDFEQLKEDILNKRIIQIGFAYFYFYEIWNSTYYVYYSFDAATKVDTSTYVNEKYVAISYGTENVYIYPVSTFKINKVEANQSLAGTESNLTELTVQSTKYKLGYLPLSGGTMTGAIVGANGDILKDFNNTTIVYKGYGATQFGEYNSSTIIKSSDVDLTHSRNGNAVTILDGTNTSANPGNTTATLTSLKLNGTNYAIAGGTQVTFVDWS